MLGDEALYQAIGVIFMGFSEDKGRKVLVGGVVSVRELWALGRDRGSYEGGYHCSYRWCCGLVLSAAVQHIMIVKQ